MVRLADLKRAWAKEAQNLKGLRPADGLVLSALGARICYSSTHPSLLPFFDDRVATPEGRKDFLQRLARAKHFSVFAHSPVNALVARPLNLFKAFHFPGHGTVVNCRHLAEFGLLNFNDLEPSAPLYFLWLEDGIGVRIRSYDPFSPIKLPDWFAIYVPATDIGWLSVVLANVSRVFTHQFVRHTFLNFSQRSHRYTEVHGVKKPSSLQDRPGVDAFLQFAEALYHDLLKNGVPKEDARALMPQASLSTIMASAPLPLWEDFVEKRSIKAAQSEIRQVAKFVRTFLEYIFRREWL